MEYIALGFALLLPTAYIFCSIAEFLLWLFGREPSTERSSTKADARDQAISKLNSRFGVSLASDTLVGPQTSVAQKPGILIAEDHRLYRRTLETWFRDQGFIVWAAKNGSEAVETYRGHAKDIAIALLDVRMPGLDGPATLVALRLEAPSLPCCFMTASLADGQEAKLLAMGATSVFEKPLCLGEATAFIRHLINNSNHNPLPHANEARCLE
jgi:FOG: CheY-like receiver